MSLILNGVYFIYVYIFNFIEFYRSKTFGNQNILGNSANNELYSVKQIEEFVYKMKLQKVNLKK